MALDVYVIGYGMMGKTHAEMYDKNSNVGSITIVDPLHHPDPRKFTKKIAYNKEMIKGKFDVVSICVPTYMHLPMMEKSARMSQFVLVEKPLALNLKEANKMAEIAERNSSTTGCAYVDRFNKAVLEFAEAIMGLDGKLNYNFKRVGNPPKERPWYADPKKSGGPLLDLGIHDINLARWIESSNPECLEASVKDGITNFSLVFPNGNEAEMEAGWHDGPFINEVSCAGKSASISLSGSELDRDRYPNAYKAEIDSFIRLALGQDVRFPLLHEAVADMALIEQIKGKCRTRSSRGMTR